VSTIVIGPGKVNLRRRAVWPRDPRSLGMHRALAAQPAGDGRHHRLVAVVADAHRHAAGEVDAVDAFEKAVHEMLPRLLAVADDVDAAILLDFEGEQCRVTLAFGERLAVEPPRRPQLERHGQPGGLWQAAGDRRFEHRGFLAQPRIAAGSLKLVTLVPR
jgi:hypothetical protein